MAEPPNRVPSDPSPPPDSDGGVEAFPRPQRNIDDEVDAGAAPPLDTSRCQMCGGDLRLTRASGRPRREDHIPECINFSDAVDVMNYVQELKRAVNNLEGSGKTRSDRARRKFFETYIDRLTEAACTSDVCIAECEARYKFLSEHKNVPAEDLAMLRHSSEISTNRDSDPFNF